MEENRSTGWKGTMWVVLFVFTLCLAYAFVRYNIVRSTPLDHLPLYIGNKAVAMATTIVIGLSFVLGPLTGFFPGVFKKFVYLRKPLGLAGFGMGFMHAIMSLLLFDRANYERFFSENGKLTGQAELSMLFGVSSLLVFGVMTAVGIPSVEEKLDKNQWRNVLRLGYLAYVFVLLHVGIMGYQGWFRPDSWQYGMASITLISCLFIVFVLLMRILAVAFLRKK